MKYTTRAKIGKAVTEALEDRALYSTVSLQDGVLSLALDTPGRVIVDYAGPGKVWAFAGDKHAYYNVGDITSIKVTGSAGNDNIFVNPYMTTPTEMDLGAGNDTVRGSGGKDVIRAGRGNDVIFARNAEDRVDAGAGNDIVWGGYGNDTIYGGEGSDKIYGNEGDNTLDEAGSDTTIPNTPSNSGGGNTTTPPATPVDTGNNQTPDPVNENPTPSVDAPVVKVEFVKKSVAAGHSIHAHALQTELKNGTILTAKFEWTFGDDSNAKLVGWNVGHTYAKAGTYTMTLTVTDSAGNKTAHNEQITITEANRTKIYVSASGNDNNDGLTPQTAIRSVAKAETKIEDNTEILFRRGDTFMITEGMTIADSNVVIGAYGTGDRPMMMRAKDAPGRVAISLWHNSVDVTIRDLAFDSPYTAESGRKGKIAADAIFAAGKNVTVSGCEFLNVNDAVNSGREVKGLLVENNTAPLVTGIRGYLVWGQGSDHVYLNNYVANSTREHCVRVNATTRILIAGNEFANLERTSVDKDDISKGAIELHSVTYGYATGNTVRDGALRAGPRGGSTEAPSTKAEWIVFEDNKVNGVSIAIRPGTHHVMVRNNLVNNESGEAIEIFRPDEVGRTSSDITIDNNTAVNHGTKGKFIWVQGRVANGITLTDNLYIAPNLRPTDNGAAPVYVGMNDLSIFTRISGNTWPAVTGGSWSNGGINYVGTSWGLNTAYKTTIAWEAYEEVEGDQFRNVDEAQAGSYRIGASTVGSTLRLAA